MTSVRQRQNERYALDLLAAQRALYSEVKFLRRLSNGLVTAGALSGAVVALTVAGDPVPVGLVSGGSLFLLRLFTGSRERRRQAVAAAVQEEFDTYVYALPWNELVADRPSTELITRAAGRFRQRHDETGLTDWYPADPGGGRFTTILLCQRVNVAWTAPSHRHWAFVLGGLLAALIGVAGATALSGVLTGTELAAGVAAPMLAPLHGLVEAFRANLEQARRTDRLNDEITRLWRDSADGRTALQEHHCRAIQDQLYHLRAAGPLVPDLFYRLRRRSTHRAVQAQNRHLTVRGRGTTP